MNTHIVYRKKLFFEAIIYVLVCLCLGLVATYLLKSRVVSIILLILMIFPIFFLRVLLKLYTKKAIIEFYLDRFIIKIFNRSKSDFEREINLRDIISYSIQFPAENISDIKFKFKNGMSQYYSFTSKKDDKDIESEELINSFHLLIRNYNQQILGHNEIIFLPSFYASKKGLAIIILLSIFLILAIILVSLLKGVSSLPFTFIFTILIILQLVIKRNKELNYYRKH